MPTYQYACTECAERVEVVQSFTDEPLTVCSSCEGRLRKVFSPVGIVFKGSGFYRTDSRKGADHSRANGKSEEKSTSSESSSSPDSKSSDKSKTPTSASSSPSSSSSGSSSSAGSSSSSGSSSAGSASGSKVA